MWDLYICTYIHIYVQIYVQIYVHIYVHMYICVYIHTDIQIYINIYIYIHTYIYIYTLFLISKICNLWPYLWAALVCVRVSVRVCVNAYCGHGRETNWRVLRHRRETTYTCKSTLQARLAQTHRLQHTAAHRIAFLCNAAEVCCCVLLCVAACWSVL